MRKTMLFLMAFLSITTIYGQEDNATKKIQVGFQIGGTRSLVTPNKNSTFINKNNFEIRNATGFSIGLKINYLISPRIAIGTGINLVYNRFDVYQDGTAGFRVTYLIA